MPGHRYRILVIGGSGSRKTNLLLNLIKYQRPDFDKNLFTRQRSIRIKASIIYFNGREKVAIENFKNPKTFIACSKTIDDVYENLKDYDPTNKRRVLIVFDDMMADMECNKSLSPIVTDLFLKGRKLNISLVFISKCLKL